MPTRPSARQKSISCSELISASWAGQASVPSQSADPPTFRISETKSALASRHPSRTAKKCSPKVQIKFLCSKEAQVKLCFSCHFAISSGAFKPQIRSSGHVPGISLEFIYSPKLLSMSIFKNTETWAGEYKEFLTSPSPSDNAASSVSFPHTALVSGVGHLSGHCDPACRGDPHGLGTRVALGAEGLWPASLPLHCVTPSRYVNLSGLQSPEAKLQQ